MPLFKKKPVVVNAIQYTGNNFNEIEEFTNDQCLMRDNNLIIKTLEGEHIASKFDMIIKGVENEHYPCKPDIFEKTYEFLSGKQIRNIDGLIT